MLFRSELDAEEVMGAEQLVSTSAVVGLLAAAVGHQLAGSYENGSQKDNGTGKNRRKPFHYNTER